MPCTVITKMKSCCRSIIHIMWEAFQSAYIGGSISWQDILRTALCWEHFCKRLQRNSGCGFCSEGSKIIRCNCSITVVGHCWWGIWRTMWKKINIKLVCFVYFFLILCSLLFNFFLEYYFCHFSYADKVNFITNYSMIQNSSLTTVTGSSWTIVLSWQGQRFLCSDWLSGQWLSWVKS